MRHFFTTIALLLLLLFPAAAQSIVDILEKMPPSRILFSERTFNGAGAETGSSTGSVEIQYPCFKVSYGTLVICGDGKTVWYMDKADDEVTISAGNVLNTVFSDKSVTYDRNSGKVTIATADGGRREFSIELSEEFESRWPESHFRMDPSAFGPDTIVTDLR